ncbi:MAG: DEAD/DEAH box helicase [Planctomycetes bacterium]|nr:DEAD/DEAH box helicase [Planctomycetota bacterium]
MTDSHPDQGSSRGGSRRSSSARSSSRSSSGGSRQSGGSRSRGGPRRPRKGDAPRPKSSDDDEPRAPRAPVDDEANAIPVSECAFAEFELKDELVQAIADSGYRTPSPIQARTLPFALEGRDVIGQARTGTGKTAAYLVPSLQRLTDGAPPRVLVVVPTRELAMQVTEEARRLGKHLGVRSLAVYGGDSMKRQLDGIDRGATIIAATPGRLLDHLGRRTLSIEGLDVLVLDEADRMFDLGFREDIAKIMRYATGRRQTFLFSATLSDEVLDLAHKYMNDPAKVFLAPDKMTVDEVDQTVFAVDQQLKLDLLVEVLKREQPDRSIIFTRTKIGADRLAMRLQKKGIEAREMHSGLPQKKRERILADFREGAFHFLIATDVAARGIDIDDVSHVINYDIPENPEDYVHRIGRTARMGKTGRAVTFVTRDDGEFLTSIEKLINKDIPTGRYDDFVHRVDEPEDDAPKPPAAPQYTRTLQGFVRPRRRR